ncbi:hypothetical protein HXZ52_11920 [Clostridium cadaveris]|nr:hypothetical protein [Clostridium cadaveris]
MDADLRDTDLRGADLEYSIFLTQQQVNSAKGNASTKLPRELVIPSYWDVHYRFLCTNYLLY